MSETAGSFELERDDDGSVTLMFEQKAGPRDGAQFGVRFDSETWSEFVRAVVRFDYGSSGIGE